MMTLAADSLWDFLAVVSARPWRKKSTRSTKLKRTQPCSNRTASGHMRSSRMAFLTWPTA
eukprot:5751086-Alexandrium_andersonii.AAC.1